jgi:hypothetical protein
MPDEVEFQILTQSLAQKNFGGRVVAADRLRRGLSVAGVCLGLLTLAVLMALTNTASVLISLAVVGVIAIEVGRAGLRRQPSGPQPARPPGNVDRMCRAGSPHAEDKQELYPPATSSGPMPISVSRPRARQQGRRG